MESRITELEIKISYAEDMIDELNRTVFRQQQQIDYLAREVKHPTSANSNSHPTASQQPA